MKKDWGSPGNEATRVIDRYLDTTNNRTLIRREISRTNNQLYYGNEG